MGWHGRAATRPEQPQQPRPLDASTNAMEQLGHHQLFCFRSFAPGRACFGAFQGSLTSSGCVGTVGGFLAMVRLEPTGPSPV
eukprot:6169370-Alexandrium_andersonii.AAC.1